MLDEGRGRLVPFKDSAALAEQVNDLLDHEVERHAMRKRADTYTLDNAGQVRSGQIMNRF